MPSTAKKGPTPPRKEKRDRVRSTRVSPAPPVVSPEDDKYAPTAWGSLDGGPQELEMPSGQLALVRRPGLEKLMVEGVLHRMDNLTQLVDERHIRKIKTGDKPSEALNIKTLLDDSEAMESLIHTVDRVVCAVVIRPVVQMTPNDVTLRVRGAIYTDTIDLADKMFLFNFAIGGSKDLERFRRESEEVVGSLAIGDAMESATE